jgi:hypothetical protein
VDRLYQKPGPDPVSLPQIKGVESIILLLQAVLEIGLF